MTQEQQIRNKLANLAEYLSELKSFEGLTLDRYVKDKTVRRAVERLLQLVVEVGTDIASLIARASGQSPPQTHREAFLALAACGVCDPSLVQSLARSAGLRNRLVHDYDALDDYLVHGFIADALRDYGALLVDGRAWVNARAGQS